MNQPTYRFVMADDPRLWPADAGPGGLLRVSEGEQLDGFDRLTQDACALIVICGIRHVAAVRRASALARSRGQARVAVVPLALGPVGHGVVAALAQKLLAVAPERSVAEIITSLPAIAGSLLDLGLVAGVAKIDHPGVALRHHLLSYLPGRRLFVVQIAPSAAIARVSRAGALSPVASPLHLPAFDDTYGVAVTVVGDRGVPDVVMPYCRTSSVTPLGPTDRRLVEFWGDQEATEVVVAPGEAARWAEDQLPRLEVRACAWCGEPRAVTVDSCVFCGHVAR